MWGTRRVPKDPPGPCGGSQRIPRGRGVAGRAQGAPGHSGDVPSRVPSPSHPTQPPPSAPKCPLASHRDSPGTCLQPPTRPDLPLCAWCVTPVCPHSHPIVSHSHPCVPTVIPVSLSHPCVPSVSPLSALCVPQPSQCPHSHPCVSPLVIPVSPLCPPGYPYVPPVCPPAIPVSPVCPPATPVYRHSHPSVPCVSPQSPLCVP